MSDLSLKFLLPAPPHLIWRCWAEPDLLKQWFMPKPVETIRAEIDLRPGGRFDTVVRIDGSEHTSKGSFLEAKPYERLVFTDAFGAGYQPLENPFFVAIVTMEDRQDQTDYSVLVRHKSKADAEWHENMGFSKGWSQALDQLGELAASLA